MQSVREGLAKMPRNHPKMFKKWRKTDQKMTRNDQNDQKGAKMTQNDQKRQKKTKNDHTNKMTKTWPKGPKSEIIQTYTQQKIQNAL